MNTSNASDARGEVTEAGRLAVRRTNLEARAAIRRAVRDWFAGEGFLEVETPARVYAPGQEIHLDALPSGGGRFLITSPEYHMKRLLGAGYGRIYQLARSYRAGERGPDHEPEFTMLEWYRPGEPLDALARDCERLVEVAARAVGRWPDVPVPPRRARGNLAGEQVALTAPFERTTVRELLARHAAIDLRGDETVVELAAKAARSGTVADARAGWDDIFFQLFLDHVEPHLGRVRPSFVFDWPAPLAALARRKADDPRLAERFELYAGGLELANAFGELIDPTEQRARFDAESRVRAARGKAVYPLDERLLEALSRMPPTSGIALGFDRLIMLILGVPEIRDVLAFADDEI